MQYLEVDIMLGILFIDRKIRGIFPSEKEVGPLLPPPVRILSRSDSAAAQLHLSGQDWTIIPAATSQVARKTVEPPQSEICVLVISSASGPLQLEPESIGPTFPMFYIAPSVIEPTETKKVSHPLR